jgi:predicted membrane protein
MDNKKSPVFIAGTGFAICAFSFLLAYLFGRAEAFDYIFYSGFIICTIGVLIGFFTFGSGSKNND